MQQRPKMEFPRTIFETVYFKGWIYAIGGGGEVENAERYSIAREQWFALSPMPVRQTHISLVPCSEGAIYSLGVAAKEMSVLKLELKPAVAWSEICLREN